MTTKNLYHRRLVDQASARACWICYKPSPVVLITPESDDWFHICASHLQDRNFAIPQDAEDPAKKKRDEEIQAEIEALKKEYDEKQRKKAEKRKSKDSKDKSSKAEDDKAEKEKQDKIAELEKKREEEKATAVGPRIFELSKNFYQMRLQKKRDVQVAKTNRARLQDPSSFPSVPTSNP